MQGLQSSVLQAPVFHEMKSFAAAAVRNRDVWGKHVDDLQVLNVSVLVLLQSCDLILLDTV